MRAGIDFSPDHGQGIVLRGHQTGIEIFMPGNFFQAGKLTLKLFDQRCQRPDLRAGIGLGHLLVSGVEPVRKTAGINQFYTDALRVKTPDMVRYAIEWHPLFNTSVAVNVKMAAVAGVRLRMMFPFAINPRHGQVRQFGAMDYDQADVIDIAAFQALYIM